MNTINGKGIDYYCRKFSPKSQKTNPIGLNVSLSAGVAPNKPVLLLAVIELITRGDIQHNVPKAVGGARNQQESRYWLAVLSLKI
jgi:predicted restriction endonuclease